MPNAAKVHKMLNKLKAFIDSDYREQLERKEKIIEVLQRLKKRTKAIERQLETVPECENEAALLDELELIKAQRKKAIQVIKRINEEGESQ